MFGPPEAGVPRPGHDGELRFDGGLLEGNVGGDGTADFQITLSAGATGAMNTENPSTFWVDGFFWDAGTGFEPVTFRL